MDQTKAQEESPLVTVLLPCYNGMPFLTEALQSIREQSYTNLEILCIDDGSTDETLSFLQNQAKMDSRILVVKNEMNLGLIPTLNKSVEMVKGEFIARVDADDIADINLVKSCLQYLLTNKDLDFVCPQNVDIREDGQFIRKNIARSINCKANFFASFFFTPFSHGGMVCKSDLLKSNPYLTEDKALHTEDYEIFSRLLSHGYNMINIPEYLYKIRINSSSVSRTYTALQDENFLVCASDHFFRYTGRRLSPSTRKIFRNRITGSYSLKEIQQALKELKTFMQFFITKEKIKSKSLIKEINGIYRTHRMDILIQAFKRGRFLHKLVLFFPLLGVLFFSLFNPVSRMYLLAKFNL